MAISALAFAPASVAASLSLSTPYPSVVVAPGSKVSFDITVQAAAAQQVAVATSAVPAGWTATLRGGGYVVAGVETDAAGKASIRLDLTIPTAAADATSKLSVTASSGGARAALPITVQVTSAAAGDLTLSSDFPSLRGPTTTKFTFNLTLANDTAEDLTYAVTAVGPDGWTVDATLTGQSQAASAVVKAGSSAAISVSAQPSSQASAGSYPIDVRATAGERTIDAKLTVEITGSNAMTLTTPDQRLSNSGSAGSAITQQIVLRNDGTSELQGMKLSATTPTDWKVTFAPSDTVASIAAGQSATVTATITPSSDAIAGDYVVTFNANGTAANGSVDIRVTIETSPLWGFFGLGLIAIVVFGLLWVFQRYGRR